MDRIPENLLDQIVEHVEDRRSCALVSRAWLRAASRVHPEHRDLRMPFDTVTTALPTLLDALHRYLSKRCFDARRVTLHEAVVSDVRVLDAMYPLNWLSMDRFVDLRSIVVFGGLSIWGTRGLDVLKRVSGLRRVVLFARPYPFDEACGHYHLTQTLPVPSTCVELVVNVPLLCRAPQSFLAVQCEAIYTFDVRDPSPRPVAIGDVFPRTAVFNTARRLDLRGCASVRGYRVGERVTWFDWEYLPPRLCVLCAPCVDVCVVAECASTLTTLFLDHACDATATRALRVLRHVYVRRGSSFKCAGMPDVDDPYEFMKATFARA